MGRPILQYVNDENHAKYVCATCRCDVASVGWQIWEGFMSAQRPAYLLRETVNVEPYGPLRREQLSTGEYSLIDVRCRSCAAYLGWRYLEAVVREEKYKEGATLLQQDLLQCVALGPAARRALRPDGFRVPC